MVVIVYYSDRPGNFWLLLKTGTFATLKHDLAVQTLPFRILQCFTQNQRYTWIKQDSQHHFMVTKDPVQLPRPSSSEAKKTASVAPAQPLTGQPNPLSAPHRQRDDPTGPLWPPWPPDVARQGCAMSDSLVVADASQATMGIT